MYCPGLINTSRLTETDIFDMNTRILAEVIECFHYVTSHVYVVFACGVRCSNVQLDYSKTLKYYVLCYGLTLCPRVSVFIRYYVILHARLVAWRLCGTRL